MPLWIVATPIGTLGDFSSRAAEVVEGASLIAAEDTRVTRRLFGALKISAPRIVSVRAKNEKEQVSSLVEEARNGNLVYMCDAGTPGISDPGAHLVEAVLEAGVRVLSVPGPSALSTALSVSGFQAVPSFFAGFAPKKGRENWVLQLLNRSETLVVFEGPSRIRDLVKRCAAVAPHRKVSLCRELSKRHEEILRGSLVWLQDELVSHENLRGEMVLVIGPDPSKVKAHAPSLRDESHSAIAKALAVRWGVSKQDVYRDLSRLAEKYRGQS